MNIVPRSAWSARPPTRGLTVVPSSKRTEVYLHWNGGLLHLTDPGMCPAAVRAIQAGHIGKGWADIGYNYLVCPHGVVFEGRGRDYQGAHCPGHNHSGIGVQAMIGKGETSTPAMLAAITELIAALESDCGHSLVRKGHRDGYSTECPGNELYAWIIHSGATATPPAPAPAPAPAPTPAPWLLRRGSSGPQVHALQAGLLRVFPAYAYPIRRGGGPNGVYGPATEQVVKEFQRRVWPNERPDGMVGPRTRAKLAEYGVMIP